MSQNIESEIELNIKFALSRTDRTVFENLLDKFQTHFEKSATNIYELQKKTTKAKGTHFEVFCKLYLKAKGYKTVYLLKEVPDELMMKLGLKRQDVGIDLIVEDHDGQYSAVQSKYKIDRSKSTGKPNVLSWKSLATFYALCDRTGPFVKYIVMTNCVYTRKFGHKDPKDKTIAFNKFNNEPREFWLRMINSEGHRLGSEEKVEPKNMTPTLNIISNNTLQPVNPINNIPEIKISQSSPQPNKSTTKPNLTSLRDLRLKFYQTKVAETSPFT